MRSGIYIGQEPNFLGQRALLRPGPDENTILAQFNLYDRESYLKYCWTHFPITDWQLDPEFDWNTLE